MSKLNPCPQCGGPTLIDDFELRVICKSCGAHYNPFYTNDVVRAWNRLLVPTIVCLCGSTRFYEAFMKANYEETMAGHIVLSVGFFVHSEGQAHGESVGCSPEQKLALDELHKRKIDLADEILVLNIGGYVGESTRSEIEYAEALGKPIRYLEPVE